MEITAKIRKDFVLLKCYARPNNPRQAARRADEGDINLTKQLMVQKIAPYFSKLKMDNGQLKII